MLKKGWVVLFAGLVLSCSQDNAQPMDNPTQINKYYPLKDFVEKQVELLDGSTVRKLLMIKGKEEETTFAMDAEGWRKELDIFIHADINKASLATAYETEEGEGVIIHRLKPGEKAAIQEIKVERDGEQVRLIAFKAFQDDFFYTTSSEGKLEIGSSGTVRRYEVSGSQKVWFLSPNKMSIRGEILK